MQNAIDAHTAKPRRKKYLFLRIERHASPTFHSAGRGTKSRHENGRDNEAAGQKKKKRRRRKERKRKKWKAKRRKAEEGKNRAHTRSTGPREQSAAIKYDCTGRDKATSSSRVPAKNPMAKTHRLKRCLETHHPTTQPESRILYEIRVFFSLSPPFFPPPFDFNGNFLGVA